MVMLSKYCIMAYAKCIEEDELSYEFMGCRPKGRERRELWTQTELVGRQADVARSTPATVEARPTPAAPTARMSTASSSTDRPLRPRVSVTPTSQRVDPTKGKGKGRGGKPEFSDKGKQKGKDKGKPEFVEKGKAKGKEKGKPEFADKGKGKEKGKPEFAEKGKGKGEFVYKGKGRPMSQDKGKPKGKGKERAKSRDEPKGRGKSKDSGKDRRVSWNDDPKGSGKFRSARGKDRGSEENRSGPYNRPSSTSTETARPPLARVRIEGSVSPTVEAGGRMIPRPPPNPAETGTSAPSASAAPTRITDERVRNYNIDDLL
jgi:hypothetical protein